MALHLSRSRRSTRERASSDSSSTRTPYAIVTNKILQALEAGVVPWRKPWHENSALPCNAVSRRPYHGINLLLLGLSRYQDHRWLTYRQAEELGGHVKPREQSSIAVFWKRWETPAKEQKEEDKRRERIPLLRFYHLFNVEQCEGLALPELALPSPLAHQSIERAEELVRNVPSPPRFHKGCKQACYYPIIDVVQMPAIEAFESPDAYYATLFHELGHATGHQSRLNRAGVTGRPRFGSEDYSREELVAELTSAFCCANLGLDNSLINNAASYIDGWHRTLKADRRAIITASSQAHRAADYLQGISPNEDSPGSEVKPELLVAVRA